MAVQSKNLQKQSRKNKVIQKKTTPSNTSFFSKHKYWLYIAAIILIFSIAFVYVFDKKLDLNGDATDYYMCAQSIVQGYGYVNISTPEMLPTNVFPPGYPLLMSTVMFFTDSIIAQKVLNGLFLLAAVIILFFWARKTGKSNNLAFVAMGIILLNPLVWKFTTIMMSEASFILFSTIALYLLSCIREDKPFFKDKYFYALAAVVAYSTLIRSQGLALVGGIVLYFLFAKKWWHSIGFIAGYFIFSLPWSVRDSLYGLSSRYYEQALMVNSFRPEEGYVTLNGFIERFFDTLGMLISKGVPNSIAPYLNIDYSVPSPILNWILGIIILVIIGIGFWQFKKYKYFLVGYVVINVGILCSCSWMMISQNRYLTSVVPFLDFGLIIGLYTVISFLLKKASILKFSPLFLLLVYFLAFPQLKERRLYAQQPITPNAKNYIEIAKQFNRPDLQKKIVCVRKPSVFYTYSKGFVCGYAYSSDRKVVIQGLIDENADYVVVDQLGYASTPLYLVPAIQNNPDLFPIVMHLPNPDTYLLLFEKEKAKERIKNNEIK